MSEINFDLKYFQNKYGDIIKRKLLKKDKISPILSALY